MGLLGLSGQSLRGDWMMKNSAIGILAIVLGLIVMAFPIAGVITASFIAGFAVIMIAIWLLISSIVQFDSNKTVGILNLIIGILALIVGIGLIFNPVLFSFLTAIVLYLAGIFLLVSGIISLIPGMENKKSLWSGISSIILGILYIIIGIYAFNPLYLGVLIGIWLIVSGVFLFLDTSIE